MRAYLTPRMLGAHLAVLLAVCAAAGLGWWQLDAWHQRRSDAAVDLTHATPVPLSSVMGHDDPFPGRSLGAPMQVRGTWLPQATVYVSGRTQDGVDGYWVVTPLTDGGPDDPAIPVVRGWVRTPDDAPAAPAGVTDLTGWLQPSDSSGAPDTDPTDDIEPALRVADLVQRVHQDLYSGYLVSEQPTAGLAAADLAQVPPVSPFTALRNLFYAVEWWFFGGFAAFVWWRFVRDERDGDDEDDADAEGEDREPSVPPVASRT